MSKDKSSPAGIDPADLQQAIAAGVVAGVKGLRASLLGSPLVAADIDDLKLYVIWSDTPPTQQTPTQRDYCEALRVRMERGIDRDHLKRLLARARNELVTAGLLDELQQLQAERAELADTDAETAEAWGTSVDELREYQSLQGARRTVYLEDHGAKAIQGALAEIALRRKLDAEIAALESKLQTHEPAPARQQRRRQIEIAAARAEREALAAAQ